MKLIEIPENVTELRDYNKFINTIVEVQKFNKNVSTFLLKVLYDEFYKTVGEWRKTITEQDNLKINKLFEDELKTKRFVDSELSEDISESRERLSEYENDLSKGLLVYDGHLIEDLIEDEKININNLEDKLLSNDLKTFDKYHIFYCYEKNEFIRPGNTRTNISLNWNNPIVEPSECGLKIIVTFKDSYKEAPTPGWLPTYYTKTGYIIDLTKKSVKKSGEIITETSNK